MSTVVCTGIASMQKSCIFMQKKRKDPKNALLSIFMGPRTIEADLKKISSEYCSFGQNMEKRL